MVEVIYLVAYLLIVGLMIAWNFARCDHPVEPPTDEWLLQQLNREIAARGKS